MPWETGGVGGVGVDETASASRSVVDRDSVLKIAQKRLIIVTHL